MRLLLIASFAIIFFAFPSEAYWYWHRCAFRTDPNLIPFSSTGIYFCSSTGSQTLFRNSYIDVRATVSGVNSWYTTTDYSISFKDTSGTTICTLQGNAGSTICSSSAVSSFSYLGIYWLHFYSVAGYNYYITITRRWWWPPSFYNIYIWHSPNVPTNSVGLCVHPTCIPLFVGKRDIASTPESHRSICQAFVDAALARLETKVDDTEVANALNACLNDLKTSNNAYFAQSVVESIILNSLKDLTPEEIKRQAEDVFGSIEKGIQEGTAKANEIIKSGGANCKINKKCIRPMDK